MARTDEKGVIISRTRYEPYGATAGGATPTIGFTGHVNDADTGLTYMQQRYYDPVAGRFMSVDPVLTDANSGASFNRYVYANNSPYSHIDPDGRNATVAVIVVPILIFGAYQHATNPQFRAVNTRIYNAVVNLFKPGSTTTAPLLNNGSDNSSSNSGASGSASAEASAGSSASDGSASNNGNKFPDRELPRDTHGNPVPDAEAEGAHTQLGQKEGRNGKYDQAREFDSKGKPVKDIDFTDHGRPQNHPNPHQHRYIPNPTGGTPQRGPTEPVKPTP